MNSTYRVLTIVLFLLVAAIACRAAADDLLPPAGDIAVVEQQFRELPKEARRLTGPLFWLHGDESKERLEMYVGKVAEGGNGSFTAESRPHSDWLGEGWWRDLSICLDAAKKNNLQMWIFDEKWWPSQGVGGAVPPRYATKCLAAATVDVEGPHAFEAADYCGERYVAAVVGRIAADGKLEGDSLVDLAPFIHDGKLAWQAPAGKWQVVKFAHVPGPALSQNGQLSIDGASKDCVDWFLKTVYQPHYDHFKDDFGKTIPGFFFDEPETCGDWGTELNVVLTERNVDWKKAFVAHKLGLSGEEQIAAKYQYLDAFAEAWGRTMYGRQTEWCHRHGVKSIGHFIEHSGMYHSLHYCAGDMMRLQGYCDMGALDAVFRQFQMGKKEGAADNPVWQTPKLASSISHVFGKPNDVTMVEIYGARGQDLTYSEMKWWADHMQVSGVNFLIPHSFNPRSPYDTDCPPYFFNGGFEPRWPLYRVIADYTSRLSVLLAGGRHVCPVALLYMGQSAQVGRYIRPDDLTTALQDGQLDCDWLPYDVFARDCRIVGKELQLRGEQYKVIVVPPVEVIELATLAKVKEFFEAGGVVLGYGFLPDKSASLGHKAEEITSLCNAIWGENASPGLAFCRMNPAGGRSYFLGEKPTSAELQQVVRDAGIRPTLEVLSGETGGWLHVLHRVKADRDCFLVCNQNHEGAVRQFKFRAIAAGEPECWDAVRNEITSIPFRKTGDGAVEFSLNLEPLESTLIVFQATKQDRPPRIDATVKPTHEPIALTRDPNPAITTSAKPPEPQDAHTLANTAWVWFPDMESGIDAPPCTRYFRKTIALPADRKVMRARFMLAADNGCEVFVNGKRLGKADSWNAPTEMDLAQRLQAGANVVAVAATNGGFALNPAGIVGRLWIEFDQGSPLVETIDKTWKTAKDEQNGWQTAEFDDSAWVSAKEVAKMGDSPWGDITIGRPTLSPVVAADPFRAHFTIPADVNWATTRVCLEMDDLPDSSASVSVNGVFAGGVIGRPSRLDITRCLKKNGENTIFVEPLTPKSARLVFYTLHGQ